MIPIDLEAEEPKVKLVSLAILKIRRVGMTELKLISITASLGDPTQRLSNLL
jgi:hypothetical protein